MNLTSKPLLAGAGGLIIGALIGIGIGSSGGSSDHAEVETQKELAAGIGSLGETLQGVDAKIAALEGRMDTMETSVAALGEAQTGRLDAISAKLEGFGSEFGGEMSALGGTVAASLGAGLDALKTQLASVGERLKAPEAAAPQAAETTAAKASGAGGATGAAPAGEFVPVGGAARLGDALSVFVSGMDPEAGTARVAVNGPTTMALALGEPVDVAGCSLALTGFGEGGAYMDATCGETAATPAAGAAAPAGQAGAAPAGEAIGIGAAGSFGEGKVRIFVSGVDNEAMTARVALNGLRTAEMKLQDKVDAEGCKVELTGINADGATFKVDC